MQQISFSTKFGKKHFDRNFGDRVKEGYNGLGQGNVSTGLAFWTPTTVAFLPTGLPGTDGLDRGVGLYDRYYSSGAPSIIGKIIFKIIVCR